MDKGEIKVNAHRSEGTYLRRISGYLAVAAIVFSTAVFGAQNSKSPIIQPSIIAYEARIPAIRSQIPAIVKSATFAAEHIMKYPDSLLNVPYWEQVSFSEEMINRSGGLAHAYPSDAPDRRARVTDHDIVVLSVRSWQADATMVKGRTEDFRRRGWKTILIASKAGMPDGIIYDYFIDNGAPSGEAKYGATNLLANVTIGWMWCCEYVSAMTRKGKIPGILISVALEGAEEYDRKIQTPEGRHWIGKCKTPIPAGKLAEIYLKRVEKLIADMKSDRIQKQIAAASDIIAKRMAEGKRVGLSGVGHVILDEVHRDTKAPWVAFQAVGAVSVRHNGFMDYLKPGDLLVWIAYMGLDSKYTQFSKYIKEAGVDLITSFAPDPDPEINKTGALAHIDQCWQKGDAEVPLPCEPWKMAPISGINAGLVLRMLDDEVSSRLMAIGEKTRVETSVAH